MTVLGGAAICDIPTLVFLIFFEIFLKVVNDSVITDL